jgi:hypothetical protein
MILSGREGSVGGHGSIGAGSYIQKHTGFDLDDPTWMSRASSGQHITDKKTATQSPFREITAKVKGGTDTSCG